VPHVDPVSITDEVVQAAVWGDLECLAARPRRRVLWQCQPLQFVKLGTQNHDDVVTVVRVLDFFW
jgi:hypothetical protein